MAHCLAWLNDEKLVRGLWLREPRRWWVGVYAGGRADGAGRQGGHQVRQSATHHPGKIVAPSLLIDDHGMHAGLDADPTFIPPPSVATRQLVLARHAVAPPAEPTPSALTCTSTHLLLMTLHPTATLWARRSWRSCTGAAPTWCPTCCQARRSSGTWPSSAGSR